MFASGLGTWRIDLGDVRDEIRTRGYVNLRTEANEKAIAELATSVGQATGADSIGMVTLRGEGAATWLPCHTESVFYRESDLNQCFALGCLVSAPVGGATCLYDGRRAAKSLAANVPEMRDVRIRYWSTAYPGQEATHPLIWDDPDYGPVLRYRSQTDTNAVVGAPPTMNEHELYRTVDRAVRKARTLVHLWRPGDLLIVNNRFMIHTREPYEGRRVMVRLRYDDPNYRTIKIGG